MRRLSLILSLLAGVARAEVMPTFNPSGPDAEAYGAEEGYPAAWPQTQRTLVGNHSRYETIARVRRVAAPVVAAPLRRAERPLSLSWTWRDRRGTLEDYLARHPTTGLLILKDDVILAEHYQYGRTEDHRFVSQSMAKTITAMLVGIAVGEGKIRSIDDNAEAYVPALAGSLIGATPIRALLHMASGIAYREVYDGKDDAAALNAAIWRRDGEGAIAAVRRFGPREAAPDSKWHYKGLDTETLGLVLTAATGMSVADYFSSRIWTRIGAEREAGWGIDAHGQEATFCCVIATLRDWGRLGRLLAHDGAWNGSAVIPRDWVLAATTASAPQFRPGGQAGFFGYGYQTWLLPGERRQFVLLGIHGQQLFVDPQSKLVLVHTAVRPKPTGNADQPELTALWRALVAQEGG